MTSEANGNCVGLWQAGLVAGMRAVAVRAVARCAGMRHFGVVDQLRLIVVARHAYRFRVGLRQHHFAILYRRMAGVATLRLKRRMHEFRH